MYGFPGVGFQGLKLRSRGSGLRVWDSGLGAFGLKLDAHTSLELG